MDFKWRKKAKFVAYFDLVLSATSLLILVFNGIIIASTINIVTTREEISDYTSLPKNYTSVTISQDTHGDTWKVYNSKYGTVVVLIMAAASAIATIFTIVQMWASIELLHSTKNGRDPHKAIKMATNWRNVNMGYVILYIMAFIAIATESLPFAAALCHQIVKIFAIICLTFAVHIVFIFIVLQFITELRHAAGCRSPENIDTELMPDAKFQQD